jgi:type IV secretion system protein VirB8
MSQNPQEFYVRSRTWAFDMEAALRGQLGQARWFAVGAAIIAIVEAFALLLLTPLKTVVPIPILVDRQTGYTEVLKNDGSQQIRADAALVRSLLAQYVSARESFDIMTVRLDYHRVTLWSSGDARNGYVQTMPTSNPQSPLRRYPRTTIVETLVKSVSPIGPRTAMVRFATRTHDQSGAVSPPQSWVAVVTYRFDDGPMSAADRLMNPLGFQVVRYRKDAEVLLEPDRGPVASSAAIPQATPPAAAGTPPNHPPSGPTAPSSPALPHS